MAIDTQKLDEIVGIRLKTMAMNGVYLSKFKLSHDYKEIGGHLLECVGCQVTFANQIIHDYRRHA